MKFHEYRTYFSVMRGLHPNVAPSFSRGKLRDMKPMEFYASALGATMSVGSEIAFIAENQMKMEVNWIKANKPYYNIWPKIIPMLIRLDLSKKKASDVKPPMKELCLRFPTEGNSLSFDFEGEKYFVRCIMMTEAKVQGDRGLSLWIDINEVENGIPIYSFNNFRCKEGVTLEEEVNDIPRQPSADIGVVIPQEVIKNCIRVCCTLCFLADDPKVIVPDVLSKDQRKFETNPDQKFIDRAKRRGKFGWHVGRSLEVSPHIRGEHDALYWTGKGKLIPKIIRRKGCVVHKEKIEKVPSGHLGGEK